MNPVPAIQSLAMHCLTTRRVLLTASLSCVVMTGCGDGATFSPVEGKVTLNGAPLPNVYLVFQPVGGAPEQTSKGKTDADGHFVLKQVGDGRDGAMVGQHTVLMTTVPPDAMADEFTPLPRDLIPPFYQRKPLSFEVGPEGTKEANFDLKG